MSLQRSTLATLRFTPGFRPDLPPPRGPEELLEGLARTVAAPPIVDAQERARLRAELLEFRAARRAVLGRGEAEAMNGMAARRTLEEEKTSLRRRIQRVQLAEVTRAVSSRDGLGERMARFWTNHFTVATKFRGHSPYTAAFEDEAIRPHMTGPFAEMLKAAATHPAMLIYLDQHRSIGPNSPVGRKKGKGLNENLARELMELHTLGVEADYDQADVQALAALLTGFAINDGEFVYRRRWAEPGRFELLGERHRGGGRAGALRALEALAAHPATARHVSRRMAGHFVADDPPEGLVAAMVETWRASEGDLARVTETLVSHPEAWGPLGAKVRQPQEIVVAALRAAGADGSTLGRGDRFGPPLMLGAMRDMGQMPLQAPSPEGWPEAAEHWITPGAMAQRLEWAARMGVALETTHDPRAYAETALRDALSEKTAWAVAAAAEKREGFALLLASPDFNRR